ncbi:MAG: hypothetical protein ACXACF_09820 [Candidatus Hermodarchaeia archaeon]|jgi:hypothetical protein
MLPTDVLKVRLSRLLNKLFGLGYFKQPTNGPAPASYPAPIELRLMPNWYGTHSEKLNTQSAYCQVKKHIFVNPCGEKTYVLPYFSLYAGGKQVQVLPRPFVILSVEVYCKISFTVIGPFRFYDKYFYNREAISRGLDLEMSL